MHTIPINTSDETTAQALVVAREAGKVWLEPIQTGSCGSCASAALCGSKGIGSLANRLEARRFALNGADDLRIGEVVEVAFGGQNLIKAAGIAYGIPLVSALAMAVFAQAQLSSDGWTMLGALVGMAGGFGVMKLLARRLESQGALNARIVRRYRHPVHISQSGAPCDA